MENQNSSYSLEYPEKIDSKISPSGKKLKSVIHLFRESLRIYHSKIKILLEIMGTWIVFSFLGLFILNALGDTNLKYSLWFSIFTAVYYVASFLLWLWSISALLYNLKENSGFKESFQKSRKILASFVWVYFLFPAITIGGFFLFVVPGVLFLVWFSLAIFVLISEGKKGFECLFRSKHLVSGKFWPVLWRILVPILILYIITLLIFLPISFSEGISALRKAQIGEIIKFLFQLFITPFILIYGFLIYQNLREITVKEPYFPASKIRKLKYLLPATFGALFVFLFVTISLFHIFLGRDEPPIDDSDLRLEKIEIKNEDNAFYYLAPYLQISGLVKEEMLSKYWPEGEERLKEEKEIYWPDEKIGLIDNIIQGQERDDEFVKNLLEKNKEVLIDFEIAINASYYQDPIYKDPEELDFLVPLLSLAPFRTMAKLNLIAATYFFNHGKEKEAFEQTFNVVKFGEMLQEAPQPTFIDYLVGIAIKEMALQKTRIMLKETSLNTDELKNFVERLNEFTGKKKGLTKIFKAEYVTLSNTKARYIDSYFTGRISKKESKEALMDFGVEKVLVETRPFAGLNFLYKPNQTQRFLIEHFRVYIYSQPLEIQQYPLHPSEKLFIENFIGKALYNIFAISFSGVFERKQEQDLSFLTTQLLMAIKSYKVENNRLPSNLEKLVPGYISEIPKDPFDGNPIRYSQGKKIIYSVGSDLIDSGGSEGENWREMPDPTFKIEF